MSRSLPEQRAIAHILGTLDDKIEVNRRQSETLEQMARALFKAWFVDFEPVRAKMEGRWKRGQSLPGLPADLYDLFPDRLVDSELGEIPEGWEVGTLGEFAEITSGKRPDEVFADRRSEANVPLWGGNGPMGYVRKALFTQPILLTGRVGTLGSVFRIPTPCWPSDNTLVGLPRKREYFEYLYFGMKRVDFDSLNRGSTQPLLTQTDLKNQLLIVPPDVVLDVLHSMAATAFAKRDAANEESCTLAALRDALLPKLIYGELRVKDAEKFLKERGL
ncbi:MAG: restriction endonuclease subunit S [Sedimentisphaerales bacterium]|nr:restriction endonuclease subunit S [Sedimentisphaerales bacterium]